MIRRVFKRNKTMVSTFLWVFDDFIEGQTEHGLGRVDALAIIFLTLISSFMLFTAFYTWTLRKKNQKKLKMLQVQQEDLVAFKNNVFKIISHDIGGVMAGMSGILYLIKRDDPELVAHSKYIDSLVLLNESAVEILDKLFILGVDKTDISRGERMICLPNELLSVVGFAKNLAKVKNIRLLIGIEDELFGFANLTYLEFILRSLLSNAIKFSYDQGEVAFTIASEADQIIFTVTNTGTVVSDLDIMRIFTSCRSKPGTNGEKGLGISLSLCKQIADKKKYRLSVAKDMTGNISFSIQIPMSTLDKVPLKGF